MAQPLTQADVLPLVQQALSEDIGTGDLSAQLIPSDQDARATIITRESMVVCGCEVAEAVFAQVDAQIQCLWQVADGDIVPAGTVLCVLSGSARSLLTAERTALNFLQALSGTATVTHDYVQAVSGTQCRILDTRKTLPGWRLLQKYAVTCGGGVNHRIGLFDAFLIKENHIMAAGSVAAAVRAARAYAPDKLLEVEVESQAELEQALAAGVDRIMLDNFSVDQMQAAVEFVAGRVPLEASGNMSLDQVSRVARTGVDFISVGAITKHIHAIDLSMRFAQEVKR